MTAIPQLTHDLGAAVTIRHSEHTLLRYHYGNVDRYPYCHPVNLPGGPPVTLFRPFDHDWHVGMYFSWKYINGYNVWEGANSGEPYGMTQDGGLEVFAEPRAGAGLGHTITWVTSDGKPLLRDARMVAVRPLTSATYYCIDWTLRFTPLVDQIVLDRKVEWGGYAGLGVRLPRSFVTPHVRNADGLTVGEEINIGRSRWVDFSGGIDGQGREAYGGITIIDHPCNTRYPGPWMTYTTPRLQYLNAAFLRDEPFVFRQGNTLQLAYRVLVHWGLSDAKCTEGEARAFAAHAPHDEAARLFPASFQ